MAKDNDELMKKIDAKESKGPNLADEMSGWFKEQSKRMAVMLGDEQDVEKAKRLFVCAYDAIRVNPDLLACTPDSLKNCILMSAQLGLFPGIFQQCAYVPRSNKKVIGGQEVWRKEACWEAMFQGLNMLVINSGYAVRAEANVVYECECYNKGGIQGFFDFEEGSKNFLKHKKSFLPEKDRGDVVASYSLFLLPDKSSKFYVLPIDEIMAIKSKSKAKSGPWSGLFTDFNEMACKTAVKRNCKLIPKDFTGAGARLAQTIAVDNESEMGTPKVNLMPDIGESFDFRQGADPTVEPTVQEQPAALEHKERETIDLGNIKKPEPEVVKQGSLTDQFNKARENMKRTEVEEVHADE